MQLPRATRLVPDNHENPGEGPLSSRSACGSGQVAAWLLSVSPQTGTDDGDDRRLADRFCFSPKNSGPDHAVPVIFRAIADSER
jgi:hypothetical protein